MSAKERIEQTPAINELEMQWLRGRPSELYPYATNRHMGFVEDGWEVPDPRMRSRIHTHVFSYNPAGGKGTPSLYDFSLMFDDIEKYDIRNWHIASLSNSGEVIGYFSMRAAKGMVEAVKNRTEEQIYLFAEIDACCAWGSPNGKTTDQFYEEILERLKRIGLSVRIVPMEGYIFDREKRKFVKEK